MKEKMICVVPQVLSSPCILQRSFNFFTSPVRLKLITALTTDHYATASTSQSRQIMNEETGHGLKIGRPVKTSVNLYYGTVWQTLPTLPVCWIVKVSALLATKIGKIRKFKTQSLHTRPSTFFIARIFTVNIFLRLTVDFFSIFTLNG